MTRRKLAVKRLHKKRLMHLIFAADGLTHNLSALSQYHIKKANQYEKQIIAIDRKKKAKEKK